MSGIFGAVELSAGVVKSVATTNIAAPGGIVASLNVCNRSNAPVEITVAVTTVLDTFDSASQYIEYQTVLQPHEAIERSGLTVQNGYWITVLSSGNFVNATSWGISNGRTLVAP
tara:strand:- start:193 stop:534 length:342 start_codon:yes stop_codon:yes gene_type:complete